LINALPAKETKPPADKFWISPRWLYSAEKTASKGILLVPSMSEWESQTNLQPYVTAHYLLIDQGDGYLIFDLRHPVPAS